MSVPAIPSLCQLCTRYQPGGLEDDGVSKCAAFPNGIPPEILKEAWDHREPLGDEKILFEQVPGKEEAVEKWEQIRQMSDEADFAHEVGPELEPL